MKKLDLKIVDCKNCPFVGEDGKCTLRSTCITSYEDILRIEEFFKEQEK